jgi:hypothetical protein
MPRRRTSGLTGRQGVRQLPNGGFYRITGYRASNGTWMTRNPRTGHWHTQSGRHTAAGPSLPEIVNSGRLNIEVDPEGDGRVKYLNVNGGELDPSGFLAALDNEIEEQLDDGDNY